MSFSVAHLCYFIGESFQRSPAVSLAGLHVASTKHKKILVWDVHLRLSSDCRPRNEALGKRMGCETGTKGFFTYNHYHILLLFFLD